MFSCTHFTRARRSSHIEKTKLKAFTHTLTFYDSNSESCSREKREVARQEETTVDHNMLYISFQQRQITEPGICSS